MLEGEGNILPLFLLTQVSFPFFPFFFLLAFSEVSSFAFPYSLELSKVMINAAELR